MSKKDDLKQELTDLSIEFDEDATNAELQGLIDNHYDTQDENYDKPPEKPVDETDTKKVNEVIKNLENTTQKGAYLTVDVKIGTSIIPKNTVLNDITIRTLKLHGCEKYIKYAKVQ